MENNLIEKFLSQTFTIDNHPIRKFKECFRLQYLRGIGEFLCYLTKNDKISKLVFEIWCTSIIGYIPKDAWSYTLDFYAIKEALYIYRDGQIFFTIRQSFLFDCFYLLEKSQKELRLKAYTFLADKVCGFFTKSSLDYAYDFFKGSNGGDMLPDVLKRHRRTSQNFINKKIKRVLIVATMSAGKSTFVNALVGHKINQVRSTACTSIIHHIYNKPTREGAIAEFGERNFIYTTDYSQLLSENIDYIGINFNSSLSKCRICILDTPGINYNRDKSHGELSKRIISDNNYDLLVLVLNARQLAIDDEMDLIEFVGKQCKQKIIGVLNQCDAFKPSQDSIDLALKISVSMFIDSGIKNPLIIPISAQAAYLSRQARELGNKMDEDEEFEFRQISKRLLKSYYNLPSYLPGVPKSVQPEDVLERSGIPYLEYLISTL